MSWVAHSVMEVVGFEACWHRNNISVIRKFGICDWISICRARVTTQLTQTAVYLYVSNFPMYELATRTDGRTGGRNVSRMTKEQASNVEVDQIRGEIASNSGRFFRRSTTRRVNCFPRCMFPHAIEPKDLYRVLMEI